MKNQCQHLKETQRNKLMELIQKTEEFFDITLGNSKTNPVDLELKEYARTTCSRPYAVPKVHKKLLKKRLNV